MGKKTLMTIFLWKRGCGLLLAVIRLDLSAWLILTIGSVEAAFVDD